MNYGLVLRTVSHLKPIQVFYQVKYRFMKPAYVALEAPAVGVPKLQTAPIARYQSAKGEVFSFLNLEHQLDGYLQQSL